MPIVNNYDAVKIIAGDIKDAVVKELSSTELAQIFDQKVVAQILDGSFFFGDGVGSGDTGTGNTGSGTGFEGSGGSSGNSGNTDGSGNSESKVELTEEQKKYQKQLEQRYKDSVSARTMLLLATEVNTGNVGEIASYSVPVKKGNVDGWTLVARYPKNARATDEGTSAALWVNGLDKETYCLSIAGTDQWGDMLQYIPMETSASRAKQQKEVDEIASGLYKDVQKNKTALGLGDIKKLYITGHSLGAFLAMSLGTDLIDASVAANKGTTTYSLTKVSDICPTLKVNNVFTYTFAAPGLMIKIPPKLPKAVKSLLKVGDVIPNWSREKIANNKDGVYDKNLIQYTNSRDVVPNLHMWTGFVFSEWGVENPEELFLHLGKEYETTSKKYTLADTYSFIRRYNIFEGDKLDTTVLNTAGGVLGLQYHLPYIYLEQLDKGEFKLIN